MSDTDCIVCGTHRADEPCQAHAEIDAFTARIPEQRASVSDVTDTRQLLSSSLR